MLDSKSIAALAAATSGAVTAATTPKSISAMPDWRRFLRSLATFLRMPSSLGESWSTPVISALS
ncbi:hypothetical protein D3C85_1615820 [compost metagenome]